MIRLQVALDSDLDTAFQILHEIHSLVDIVEIGTPLIYRAGMLGVRQIAEAYPHLVLLADLKIMDAGEEEANIAFEAGAQFVTVLGVTNNETIRGVVRSAENHKGQIVVDMMQVQNPIDRCNELISMGCHILCVHTAYDLQSSHTSPYRELEQLRTHFPDANLAIAGGVNLSNLNDILPFRPTIIIVGGAITRANDPVKQAHELKQRILSYGH